MVWVLYTTRRKGLGTKLVVILSRRSNSESVSESVEATKGLIVKVKINFLQPLTAFSAYASRPSNTSDHISTFYKYNELPEGIPRRIPTSLCTNFSTWSLWFSNYMEWVLGPQPPNSSQSFSTRNNSPSSWSMLICPKGNIKLPNFKAKTHSPRFHAL